MAPHDESTTGTPLSELQAAELDRIRDAVKKWKQQYARYSSKADLAARIYARCISDIEACLAPTPAPAADVVQVSAKVHAAIEAYKAAHEEFMNSGFDDHSRKRSAMQARKMELETAILSKEPPL